MRTTPIIVLGGGGHAHVIIDVLHACKRTVIGFVDQAQNKPPIAGVKQLGDFGYLTSNYPAGEVALANGLGSVAAPGARMEWYVHFKELGYPFASCIHPGSIVSPSAYLAEGGQVMAGAVVQPGTVVGENTLINTRASIDHECRIGHHVHVAPGAVLSGGVEVGDKTHIGTGAVVIQGVRIGRHSIVGAGAVVVHNVPDHITVKGVPAK